MKDITYEEFHELIDELEFMHYKHGDELSVVFFPTDDFDREVEIRFEVSDGEVYGWSVIPGLGSELAKDAANEFVNKWNSSRANPTVFIDEEGDFVAKTIFWTDEEVSKEYFKKYGIYLALSTTCTFFRVLDQFVKTGKYDGDER